jgi:hypothetical protein
VVEVVTLARSSEFWRDKSLAALLSDTGRLDDLRKAKSTNGESSAEVAERERRKAVAKASQERASAAMRALVDSGATRAPKAATASLSAIKEGIG